MREISTNLLTEIQKCKKCETIIGYKKFETTSHGKLKGKYLLASEAPGKKSLRRNRYWTGDGGQILRSCTTSVNTTLEELFYMTDIVKCRPTKNENDRKSYRSECMSSNKNAPKSI